MTEWHEDFYLYRVKVFDFTVDEYFIQYCVARNFDTAFRWGLGGARRAFR